MVSNRQKSLVAVRWRLVAVGGGCIAKSLKLLSGGVGGGCGGCIAKSLKSLWRFGGGVTPPKGGCGPRRSPPGLGRCQSEYAA